MAKTPPQKKRIAYKAKKRTIVKGKVQKNMLSVTAKLFHGLYSYIWPKSPVSSTTSATSATSATSTTKTQSGYLYAFATHDDYYKIGKTVNLDSRVKTYKTSNPFGFLYYKIYCNNIHYSERILHDILKIRNFHVKQEIFEVPKGQKKDIIVIMNFVKSLDGTLAQKDCKLVLKKLASFS